MINDFCHDCSHLRAGECPGCGEPWTGCARREAPYSLHIDGQHWRISAGCHPAAVLIRRGQNGNEATDKMQAYLVQHPEEALPLAVSGAAWAHSGRDVEFLAADLRNFAQYGGCAL